ncbi:MAG: His/Gly/Thr/Pro-type tRNA ligase C-terminal domain-containing protein, partial [Aquificaceae bacterium]|nr:His/Gly/Thr/Pro-type tRNA ligase C-terminal domain-containing protein [Aquificaceae bacterium]
KRVELSYRRGSLKKQLELANRLGVRYAVLVGEEEKAGGFYTLKDMETGEQLRVEFSPSL